MPAPVHSLDNRRGYSLSHSGASRFVDWVISGVCDCVCVCVCLCVRALKGKRLELPTPNLIHIYFMAVARHALTRRSKGQRSRSRGYESRRDRTVASGVCCRRGTARRMTVSVSSVVIEFHCVASLSC